MDNRPTLKDIAKNLNLSIGTVQRALHNKGGYSAETQEVILKEAQRCGYMVNPAASALRRSPINLAVVLPPPTGVNRYFFQYVWQGVEKATQDLTIYNVKIYPYYVNTRSDEAAEVLQSILQDAKLTIQGLITTPFNSPSFLSALDQFVQHEIPYFIVNSVSNANKPLCYSSNTNHGVGKLAADIMAAIHKNSNGSLLLLGGSRESERQIYRVNDFSNAMSITCPGLAILETHTYNDLPRLKQLVANYLSNFQDIVGIFSVSARETLCMCEVVHDLHFSGKITTIGTDVFPELLPYFEDSTLTASIYQYPEQQAYTAVKTLVSHIIQTDLGKSSLLFPSVAVFKSNAASFCNPPLNVESHYI